MAERRTTEGTWSEEERLRLFEEERLFREESREELRRSELCSCGPSNLMQDEESLSREVRASVPVPREAEYLTLPREYYEALKLGEVLVAYGRVMMIGPGGGGKTSLRHSLMNLELPKPASSTLLANARSVKYHWARGGHDSSQYWVQVTDDDEIEEIVQLLQKVVDLQAQLSSDAAMLESAKDAKAIDLFQPFSHDSHLSSLDEGNSREAESESRDADSEVRRLLRLAREKLSTLSRSHQRKTEVLIRLWDCGGQVVFLNILPAFLTSRTLFMLTFDASSDLDKNLQITTVQQGKVVHTEDYHLSTTDLMLQWMASIHSHLRSTKPDGTQERFPRVMLVGTHRDQLADASGRTCSSEKRIRTDLHSRYKGKYYADLLCPEPFFVDNTKAGQGENEDPAVTEIRRVVHDFISDDLSVRTPVTWALFRKVLQNLFVGQPVVKLQEVKAIAKACLIPPETVCSVLNFYHQLGVFLYFADVPGLRDVVIVDPQWLITNFAKVLSPRGVTHHGMERLWELLHSKGVLTQQLYDVVLEQAGIKPQVLINLLDHCLLAAPIPPQKNHPYRSGRWYFVPSMLSGPPKDSRRRVDSTPMLEAETLKMVFTSRYVPPGFFVRLLASIAHTTNFTVLLSWIDRNNVTFRCGEADELCLREGCETIEVHMSRMIERGHTPSFESSCREVFDLLHSSVDEVSTWLPCIQMEFAFECPQCKSTSSEQFLVVDQTTCTTSVLHCEGCGHYFDPSHQQQYWLKHSPENIGTRAPPRPASANVPTGSSHESHRQPCGDGSEPRPKKAWMDNESSAAYGGRNLVEEAQSNPAPAQPAASKATPSRLTQTPQLYEFTYLEDSSEEDFVKIIKEVQAEWPTLSTYFKLPPKTPDNIRAMPNFGPQMACQEVFKIWLEGGTREYRQPKQWKTVIKGIGQVLDNQPLADKVHHILTT